MVTGTRAEYGLLSHIIRLIHRDRALRLQLMVTAQHLMPEMGRTVEEIEADGFPVSARIPMRLRSDSPASVARAVGDLVRGFAGSFETLKPDLLLLLGDRYETFAAAAAALPLRVPVAHIHGGEATEGVIDEQARHAITKLSHFHFPAAEPYRRRILRMGEDPRRVFCFGAPGVDNIRRVRLMKRGILFSELGVPQAGRVGIVTFHPATLERDPVSLQAARLVRALDRTKDVFWVCTMPNADAGYRGAARALKAFAKRSPRAVLRASLGQVRYLSLLREADLMVGNSSSGIIEAPSFGLPVVNIGERQRGRVRGANVIDVPRCDAAAVLKGIARALSPAVRRRAARSGNPYAGRDTCARIVRTLKRVPLGEAVLKKSFHDVGRKGGPA